MFIIGAREVIIGYSNIEITSQDLPKSVCTTFTLIKNVILKFSKLSSGIAPPTKPTNYK